MSTTITDVLILACLLAVVIGLWWVWPPLALIIPGTAGLVLFGMLRFLTTTTGGKGGDNAE